MTTETGGMRRHEKSMERPDIEAFLEDQVVAHLATRGEDGQPYVVPLNYAYRPGRFIFHSAREGRKIRNILADPRVCVEVSVMHRVKEAESSCDHSVSYTSAVAVGRARVLSGDQAQEALQALADRFAPQAPALDSTAARGVAVIEVEVEHLTGKHSP